MKVKVVKHFVTDADGTHLRGLSVPVTDGTIHVTSDRSRELRGMLEVAMGDDALELVETGRTYE